MDNHPIPQDVTNFQFRLIGDMTLKQFGYVLAGVIFAWVVLASPLVLLFKLFLGAACVLCSVVLAFIPIEGRPADVILMHFFQALFYPTQFVYQKTPPVHQDATITVHTITPPQNKTKGKVQVESFAPIATAAVQRQVIEPTTAPAIVEPTQAPTTEPKKQDDALQNEAQQLSQALSLAKTKEAQAQKGTIASTQAHEKVLELEKELRGVLSEKQDLEKQLLELKKALAEKKQQVFAPSPAQDTLQETQHVKKVSKQMSVGVGTPFVSDVPNLITGVVKDPRGNVLANILIEIKDKDGNPVRAFKTNQLGQFAAATPLLNGTYTITFEDPAGKQSFDSVEITVSGDVLLPLEITSVDAREKLRQELFGVTN